MRKLAAGVIVAAIALMIAALPSTDQAQQAVATPSGEALQAKAERVRDAFLKGSPEEFMSQFAPWVQGRFNLLHGEVPQQYAKFTDKDKEEFAKAWKNRGPGAKGSGRMTEDPDPGDMLKIQGIDDFLKLSAPQMLCFITRYYRVRGGAVTDATLNAKWILVDRSIGFEQYEEKVGKESRWLSRTRGRVTFMTPNSRDGFIVTCVAEGVEWQVIDFEYRLGLEANSVSKGLAKERWDKLGKGGLFNSARHAEGEALVSSVRGQVRVAFAKLGEAKDIRRLTGAIGTGGCGVAAAELESRYFKVRDKVASTNASAKLMCEPALDDSQDGFCVYEFKWGGGDGTFTWYDTLEDLYAAHPEFK